MKIANLLNRSRKARQPQHLERPSIAELEADLRAERTGRTYRRTFRNTVFALVVAAAAAVLIATLWFPVLRIFGTSMAPTLNEGEVVVVARGSSFETGDVIGFYFGNKLLVKRYIAGPGDWVNITDDGTVYVNDKKLDEPYLTEKALGETDIKMPYQVPESRYFVMGDHRATSIDSRNTTVGCIADEQIVGKIAIRIWPLPEFGPIDAA